jgi:hypothetical protein
MRIIVAKAPRPWMPVALLGALAVLTGAVACSPGSLPGEPSPILVAGGGGRYNGTIIYRRLAGNYTVGGDMATQPLSLSLVLRAASEMTGRFESSQSSGTIAGVLNGSLASGTFQATVLVLTPASQGGVASMCEGRGDITATLAGVNLSWNGGTITYPNCPDLSTTSQAQAIAISPIPGPAGNRANVVVTVLPGASIARGTCSSGVSGFPFTVELIETSGVEVIFDSSFFVEERRTTGAMSTARVDMPFTELSAGGRRTYSACSTNPGTYQAFFTGNDANGNRVLASSPIVTMGP